jgi:hypothetical protein
MTAKAKTMIVTQSQCGRDEEGRVPVDIRQKVETYLKERFDPGAMLLEMEPLGEGVHGTAYRIRFQTASGQDRLIMKTLFPSRFGHDHYADRAQVLLLAGANYNDMPKHIRAVDVVGESAHRLISVKEAREFYIFMEEAGGSSYFNDLEAVLQRGRLDDRDRDRARMLADFLAEVHAVKYSGEDAPILYRRRIRDLIGHGECIMGIIDAYDRVGFADEQDLTAYAEKCLPWWGKIRNRHERLSSVHGDYHPGNIRLKDGDFILLDRSRGSWGEPGDDVSCLSINYLHYALKDRGAFDGPFEELFRLFFDRYVRATGDRGIFDLIQPFFAFRTLVVANPRFYPEDAVETKRKLFCFGRSVLGEPRFNINRVPDYLEES